MVRARLVQPLKNGDCIDDMEEFFACGIELNMHSASFQTSTATTIWPLYLLLSTLYAAAVPPSLAIILRKSLKSDNDLLMLSKLSKLQLKMQWLTPSPQNNCQKSLQGGSWCLGWCWVTASSRVHAFILLQCLFQGDAANMSAEDSAIVQPIVLHFLARCSLIVILGAWHVAHSSVRTFQQCGKASSSTGW